MQCPGTILKALAGVRSPRRGVLRVRDTLLVVLEALLGLGVEQLRSLTVRSASARLKALRGTEAEVHLPLVVRLLKAHTRGRGPDELLFQSATGKSGPTLSRYAIFRIIQNAVRGVFGADARGAVRVLQTFSEALRGLRPLWQVRNACRSPYRMLDRLSPTLSEVDFMLLSLAGPSG